MEDVLDKVIEDLDARFPLWNFRAVRIGQWQWNFVFDGLRVETPVEVLPGTIMQNKEEEANAGN